MKFYGREAELEAIAQESQKVRRTGTASMIVVSGRRRIGKTTLILKACENTGFPYLYCFVQRKYSEKELVDSWLKQIGQLFRIEFLPQVTKLSEVIAYLMNLAEKQYCTLVIDECQELDHNIPSFWSELQEVWDKRKNQSKLLLIMSGSIASAIKHIFGNVSEPLYGRADQMMVVRPFSTDLIIRILKDNSPNASWEDLLTFYAVSGGVARYIELLVNAGATNQDEIVDYIFSDTGSWFRADGEFVLANEFKTESPVYYQILHGIAHGATQWNEINNLVDVQINPYL